MLSVDNSRDIEMRILARIKINRGHQRQTNLAQSEEARVLS